MKRIILMLSLLFAGVADASLYRITVTRKAQDVYRVDGTSILIKTRYCYEYAYGEEAIYDDVKDELIFTGGYGGSKCDVEAVIK